jgi:hypothetical protein
MILNETPIDEVYFSGVSRVPARHILVHNRMSTATPDYPEQRSSRYDHRMIVGIASGRR